VLGSTDELLFTSALMIMIPTMNACKEIETSENLRCSLIRTDRRQDQQADRAGQLAAQNRVVLAAQRDKLRALRCRGAGNE
jgi:hypothetical protein